MAHKFQIMGSGHGIQTLLLELYSGFLKHTVANNKNFSFRHRSTSNGKNVSIVGIMLTLSFKRYRVRMAFIQCTRINLSACISNATRARNAGVF